MDCVNTILPQVGARYYRIIVDSWICEWCWALRGPFQISIFLGNFKKGKLQNKAILKAPY